MRRLPGEDAHRKAQRHLTFLRDTVTLHAKTPHLPMLAAQQGIRFMAEKVLKADNQDDICRNIAAVRQIFINFVF